MRERRPELLIPASSLEVLKTAVIFGADAVYIGGEVFGLRAKAKNFSMEEMREGLTFAHEHGVRVHVTVNILAHNRDLPGVEEYLKELKELKPDALIIADPAIFELAKEICPEIERHISTQANNTNYGTYRFWWNQGARRVVSARELSLAEIREIREKIPEEMEIESFIHGAMCISYSGRCLLSNYFTGRDANQGACTHPCRWKYAVVEETRPGEYFPIGEDKEGTYIMNSRDMCMIEHIPELIEAGISSFKIEGRMKSAYYAAIVTNAYRHAVDSAIKGEALDPIWVEETEKLSHRPYCTGFYYGYPGQHYSKASYLSEADVAAVVENCDGEGRALLTQRNKFYKGDELELIGPNIKPVKFTVEHMYNAEGEEIEDTRHPMMEIHMTLPCPAPRLSIVRKCR